MNMAQGKLPKTAPENGDIFPFFNSLQNEIERVFDRFRDPFAVSARDIFALSRDHMMAAIDVAETEDAIEITAELPGIQESDLEVSVNNGVVVLKAEKTANTEENKKDYRLVERRYGSFQRSVPLGFDPDTSKVKATFKDGVLTLNIQKPTEAINKTKKIEIAKS
jgi:HSP20 family protein